jgi:hypothetical protein
MRKIEQVTSLHQMHIAIFDAFEDIKRPESHDIVHPIIRDDPGTLIAEVRLAERLLSKFHWHEIELLDLHLADELAPGTRNSARSARDFFDLLSNAGIAYFTPAAMIIVLAEGRDAEPLLQGIVDNVDPNWVGPEYIEAGFGNWNASKIVVLLQFLRWGCQVFVCRSYKGQGDSVCRYWQDQVSADMTDGGQA